VFDAVLVANRGEIAVRVIRACRELGVRTVAVHSEIDRDALHVRLADDAASLPGATSADGYLDGAAILDVARKFAVDAIHPGYGFLAENAEFAQAVTDAGFVFVGPPADVIATMGDKVSARQAARNAGVPVVPGTDQPLTDVAEAEEFGRRYGYPIAVKAAFGGGGRGLKVVRDAAQLRDAVEAAQREAKAAFGRAECYLERYLERPRHVEVQVLADGYGTVVHLGDRDCSLQRRHQKLVEEAPAPDLPLDVREALRRAAVDLAKHVGYVNAGTCEFLVSDDGKSFYFLEMNTRLQVEHPVTELVTGVDLVQDQLRIAAGEPLGFSQSEVRLTGHAIEVRINAEDPARGFVPTPGTIEELVIPQGPWVRFDTGVTSGATVPPCYDSMIGKLVVWHRDRESARRRLRSALDELTVRGIPTTAAFHKFAIDHPDFAAMRHRTVTVESEWDLSALAAPQEDPAEGESLQIMTGTATEAQTVRDVQLTIGGRPLYVTVYGRTYTDDRTAAVPPRRRGGAARDSDVIHDGPELLAPMQGTLVKFLVADGTEVQAGDEVCIVEAMKMENVLRAHRAGTVRIEREPGDVVEQGAAVARIEQ